MHTITVKCVDDAGHVMLCESFEASCSMHGLALGKGIALSMAKFGETSVYLDGTLAGLCAFQPATEEEVKHAYKCMMAQIAAIGGSVSVH